MEEYIEWLQAAIIFAGLAAICGETDKIRIVCMAEVAAGMAFWYSIIK
ncbi:MAG: hypothetical protein IJ709_01865 [Selenomonas sp.]|nr:hypothetical protein [Selenomonas sp.]